MHSVSQVVYGCRVGRWLLRVLGVGAALEHRWNAARECKVKRKACCTLDYVAEQAAAHQIKAAKRRRGLALAFGGARAWSRRRLTLRNKRVICRLQHCSVRRVSQMLPAT